MKKLFSFLLLSTMFAACCKDDAPAPDDMNVPGLPPVTQTGANSLGFLLNGQPWTPNGNSSLSIDYDPGFNHGIVGIVAYKRTALGEEQFIIGFRDSLNFINAPSAHRLSRNSLFSVSYVKGFCDYWNQLPEVEATGRLSLTKLDRTARIIAGTFEATLYRNGCDTVRITNGRFDMKF